MGQIAQGADPLRVVVQAGDVVKHLATGVQKGFAGLHADFFQGFQAVAGEAGAHHVDAFDTSLTQRDQGGLGVGLQPFGTAQTRLKSHLEGIARQTQHLGQQARGLEAFAVVGVTQVQGALGHAMKTHHQLFSPAVYSPVPLNAAGQCADVGRVVVVAVDESQLGQVAHLGGPGVDGVKQAGGGGGRILRVSRQHQHPGHALRLEHVQLLGNAGLAIAHGVAHRDVVAGLGQPLLQPAGLLFSPDFQR